MSASDIDLAESVITTAGSGSSVCLSQPLGFAGFYLSYILCISIVVILNELQPVQEAN